MFFGRKFPGLSFGPPLRARLRQQPRPLLDEANRTVVSWSAKAGCTHVLIWHLQRVGLLSEAQNHHPWLHRYREEIYYRTPQYKNALKCLEREGSEGWTYVKVARDPVSRCVSSYRHALMHGYEDRLMGRELGREIDHRQGFSYATFLDYLERIDLRRCNIHHRMQKHSLDTVPFSRIYLVRIDEQDLEAALGHIDAVQGVAGEHASVERNAAIHRAARRHAPDSPGQASDGDLWRKPLCRADTKTGWPKAGLEACGAAAERARHIYRRDYAMLESLREQTTWGREDAAPSRSGESGG